MANDKDPVIVLRPDRLVEIEDIQVSCDNDDASSTQKHTERKSSKSKVTTAKKKPTLGKRRA
jgi:hypothetical protein